MGSHKNRPKKKEPWTGDRNEGDLSHRRDEAGAWPVQRAHAQLEPSPGEGHGNGPPYDAAQKIFILGDHSLLLYFTRDGLLCWEF